MKIRIPDQDIFNPIKTFYRTLYSRAANDLCHLVCNRRILMKMFTVVPLLCFSAIITRANDISYTVVNCGTAAVCPTTYFSANGGTSWMQSFPVFPHPLSPGQTGYYDDPNINDGFELYLITVFDTCYGIQLNPVPAVQAGLRNGNLTFFIFPDGMQINDGSDGGKPCQGCSTCSSGGMTTWQVSEPYVSLWLHDEPLGYQPAAGPRISFELSFKQRTTAMELNSSVFSTGKKWNCSWLSYVARDLVFSNSVIVATTNNVVYFSTGRQRTYYTTNDYLTNTRLTGDTTNGFTLSYPDGGQDVYGFVVTNNSGVFQEAFLTQHGNAQAQKTQLIYFGYNPTNPVVRLRYVIDGDGRTNSISYVTNNLASTNLISKVTDPFLRTVSLAYNTNGCLTNITDVAGISSSFTYNTNDVPSSLTTPYGTTSFNVTETSTNHPPSGRSVLVTQPDGGHQLYLYEDYAPGISNKYPSSVIPNTSTFTNTFDTTNLNIRNTFYWGPRQYANLSTTNIGAFTNSDFRLARMQHWLTTTNSYVGNTLSMERDPSPDTNGTIEGQKIWYDYAGKTNSAYEGTQVEPLYVAQVLPDGTTRFTRSLRNSLGAVTNEVSTYSSGGSVAFRTSVYVYDPHQIDLLITTNVLGVQVSNNSYNAYHEVMTNFDALSEKTVYTYNANQQLTSITLPSGLITTNIYDTNGLLITQIEIGFATNTYTYTNNLVHTHTDARGLTITNTWDNLNRLTKTMFPDGTSISYTYSNLDLIRVVDRMGFINSFVYDNMRRKTAETNALGAVTTYSYCNCGSLNFILDAATNETQFFYDNQGNLINTLYADGYSVTNTYNLLKQVVSTSDSGGNNVTNAFNNQGLLTTITNTFGQVQSITYDILDRATTNIDANGVSVATSYDNLNRPLARSYPDSGVEQWGYTLNVSSATSYTNQIGNIVTYAYDAMNRKTNEVYVDVTANSFTYDGAGDMLTLTDGKSQTTTWTYDVYGNTSNKVDAAGNLIFIYQYDADNRLTSRWTPAKGTTVYRYDNGGNVTNVDYSSGTVPMSSIYLAYDMLNRMTNMVDAVGTTIYSYDSAGQPLSEAGPWANDAVSYTYTNRLRMSLSLQSPSDSAWTQNYGYDSARRLTSVTSPAGGFGYSYNGAQPSSLPLGISLPNGAWITNGYDNVARLLSTKLLNSSATVLDSESYAYNQASQRTTETNTAGDFRNYAYDNAGELTSAIGKETGGTTNRLQEQLGYTYDGAGNLNYRTNNGLLGAFNVNNLNELTTVTNGGPLTVAGTTTTPTTNVTVNTSNAFLYADSTFASTNQPWVSGSNTYAAIAKDSYGRASSNSVTVNLQTNVSYYYDANGNLTNDGTRNFAYDDENQLIGVWAANSWSNNFVYDGRLRRRIERDYAWQGGAWVQTNEIHFIYDGNLVVQERNANNNPLVSYTRGSDLSGTLQGAGGIGGLLARTDYGQEIPGSPTTAYYHADGNGDITMLIYTNQIIVAKYLYDPYGNTLSMSGPLASFNLYRFSSKEWNASAGLYSYLYRFYDPMLQRWPNRDPIEERGGKNLYGFVGNQPLSHWDSLGLLSAGGGTAHTSIIEHENYISFTITCPVGTIAQNISPDYSGVLSGLESLGLDDDMLSDAFQGNFSGASDLGGLKDAKTPNCCGNPVKVRAYMRTRLSNQPYLNLLHNMFSTIDGFPYLNANQTVGAYTAGTVINYVCAKCFGGAGGTW